jgi:hypothetical protein
LFVKSISLHTRIVLAAKLTIIAQRRIDFAHAAHGDARAVPLRRCAQMRTAAVNCLEIVPPAGQSWSPPGVERRYPARRSRLVSGDPTTRALARDADRLIMPDHDRLNSSAVTVRVDPHCTSLDRENITS